MKNKRFVITDAQGSGLLNFFQIVVDTKTGVNYLVCKTGYGSGITPLLDANGNSIVTKER